jgi:hypothetical protein
LLDNYGDDFEDDIEEELPEEIDYDQANLADGSGGHLATSGGGITVS